MRQCVLAALLFATPAAAQRLDTRRVKVVETEAGTTCDFNAYPMTLIGGADGGKAAFAAWIQAPDNARPEDRDRFKFAFVPTDDWRKPAVIGIAAEIYKDKVLTAGTIGSAWLRFDGSPAIAAFSTSGDKLIFAMTRDLDGLGARLVTASTLQLDIMNPAGRIIRSYWWDVSRLGDGMETGSVVGWSCTTP